ncbi:MAG TPA: transaldolase family protein [Candidatus Krumholzibacteria bacterium]|nr:transaldolase family protein [Candidatus Krumholzibacteria bacterium]
MQILLETANAGEVREALAWRVVDGVMTDPGLMASEGAEKSDLVLELLELVPGPVMVEVTAGDTAAMIEEGRGLASLGDRVIVRVPAIAAGIPAIAALADERIPVDASLCFSVSQALLAAKAGARFLSPPVGAVDEAGGDGLTLVSSMLTMLDQFDFKTAVVVAALEHPGHVSESARMGADGAAVSLDLLRRLVEHPLTDAHRRDHLERWRRAQH